MAGNADLPTKFSYLEFSYQHSVRTALQNNGIEFKGAKLRSLSPSRRMEGVWGV